MKSMSLISTVITFIAMSAQAQVSPTSQAPSSSELTCRSKAKEIAAQTYSSCVTESRNTQIDQIRKDYQKQLADLKAKYDKELKKVGGKGSALSEANEVSKATTKPGKNPVNASTGSKPKATKGIAKSLPTRKEVKNPAPIVNAPVEDTSMNSEPTYPNTDESSSQNDAQGDLSIRFVPAQAPQDNTAATSDEKVY